MKYYVTFGDYTWLGTAGNPVNACIKTLAGFTESRPMYEHIPNYFIVSQKGYNGSDKEEWPTEEILKILTLSASCELDLD